MGRALLPAHGDGGAQAGSLWARSSLDFALRRGRAWRAGLDSAVGPRVRCPGWPIAGRSRCGRESRCCRHARCTWGFPSSPRCEWPRPTQGEGAGRGVQRSVAPDRVPTQRLRWLALALSRIPALGETSRWPQVASDNANAIQCLCRWAGAFWMRNCRARTLPIGLLSHEHSLVPLVVWRVGRPCRRLVGRGDSHAGPNSAGAPRTAFRRYRDPGQIGGRPDDEGASQHSRATAHQEFPAVCDTASGISCCCSFWPGCASPGCLFPPCDGRAGTSSQAPGRPRDVLQRRIRRLTVGRR